MEVATLIGIAALVCDPDLLHYDHGVSTLPVPRQRFVDLNQVPLSLAAGSYTGEFRNWGLIEPRPWRNYLHVHSCFEVCYAFAGRGTFHILGQDYAVGAGDVFVAKPDEPHEILSSHDAPLGIYFWAYRLLPRREGPAECDDLDDVDALLEAFSTSTRPVSDRASNIYATLELLTAEIGRREAGCALAVKVLALKLLLDTSRAVIDTAVPPHRPPRPAPCAAQVTVDRITAYLQDNLARPISVRDVAAQVHLSERHTSRLFRMVTNRSVAEYLTDLRMALATQLLLDGQLSIKQVAHAAGYPDVRYFTTSFRRRTGVPPGAFRRQDGTTFLDTP